MHPSFPSACCLPLFLNSSSFLLPLARRPDLPTLEHAPYGAQEPPAPGRSCVGTRRRTTGIGKKLSGRLRTVRTKTRRGPATLPAPSVFRPRPSPRRVRELLTTARFIYYPGLGGEQKSLEEKAHHRVSVRCRNPHREKGSGRSPTSSFASATQTPCIRHQTAQNNGHPLIHVVLVFCASPRASGYTM